MPDFYEACVQQAKELCIQLCDFDGADSRYEKKSFFSGIAAYTRQRTARGMPNKRKKMADGSSKTAPDLRLNTSDLVELEYECVDGEPPAAAAKLRSGMFAFV